jgi:hypothetical protein
VTCSKTFATWEKISFRIFGLCRKDARTLVGEYVRLSWDCVNGSISSEEIKQRLLEVGSDDREHGINWAVENIRNTNCYDGWEEELRYLMYRYEESHATYNVTNEQWCRICEQSASHSIEHIQAQHNGKAYVHRLGNLMLLPPGMNSSLGNKRPVDKIRDYRATGLFAANEVASMIEKSGWLVAQIDEREKKILEWVNSEWA